MINIWYNIAINFCKKLFMKKYWFKPKKYGYGFTPTTQEGWFVTFLLLGIILLWVYWSQIFSADVQISDIIIFVIGASIISWLSTLIFRKKISGDLKWRWGSKK